MKSLDRRDLDAESTNPNLMHFEKLVSGMYIGEVRADISMCWILPVVQ